MRPDAKTMILRPPSVDMTVTDPWGHRLSAAAGASTESSRRLQTAAWLTPAVVMGVLGALGLTRPALWTDEFATWGMTETPWSEMWPVLRWVDAVLAPYYVLMRAWSELAGSSDLALRLPSMAAMIGAAGLIGALGTRLAGHRLGLLAGLVFSVLPSSTRFAQEARPYAMSAFIAVGATFLLVRAWDKPTLGRFVVYSAAVAVLGAVHVVALLLLVAHGWVSAAWHRNTLVKWVVAATVGVLPLLPLVWLGRQQSNQVAYIPEVGFGSAGPFATVVLGTVGTAVALGVLGLFSLPLRYPTALFTAWAFVPTAALVLVSLVFSLFLPRYLIFTVPGWALLAGAALTRFRPPAAIVVLACVAALGLSAQVAVRQPDGHDEATRDVAQIIASEFQPGDAIVYAESEVRGGWTARDLVAHYVPADRRPEDPLLVRPPRRGAHLLAGECADVPRCLGAPKRLWVVRLGEYADPLAGLGAAKEQVLRTRYSAEQAWRPRNLTLALLVPARAG